MVQDIGDFLVTMVIKKAVDGGDDEVDPIGWTGIGVT
jgi:hypothetical protein